ncbi:FAD binding domain-containing protein [Lojkania enalia]|uniref:FAD binding domain-containing protein n=1 Tax=Lojkania enalia TaxID=147567 RepID=A0A9P4K1V1_9PLEO|nr:FAD binding domain-containing protein [Didymosphaeria enalia]
MSLSSVYRYASFISLLSLAVASPAPAAASPPRCKVLPGDAAWPKTADWNYLNKTVGGSLTATVPLASVCHDPNYDEEKCNDLKARWHMPIVHEDSPTALMSGYFQTDKCSPFTPREQPCELGNYPPYTVTVSSAKDIQAAIRFAQSKNIRFVIKNTGHDFVGRSTGKGALGIWTHKMTDVKVINNYRSSYYNGPALKMAAGVRGAEALPVAQKAGLHIVAGSCPSVGLVGGYHQGGGHSSLTSTHGMGADQALEWEVVLADGSLVTATPTKNRDLYWALSGGGPGTFGVVVSLTVRAFKDGNTGGAFLSFTSEGISNDTYWSGVEAFHANAPAMVDAGAAAGYLVGADSFLLAPMTKPGASDAEIRKILKPVTSKLDELKIQYTLNVTVFPTFLDHYTHYLGPIPEGAYPIDRTMGGRFVPRSVLKNDRSLKSFVGTLRELSQTPGTYLGIVAMQSSAKKAIAPNSITPKWRDATLSILAQTQWYFGDSSTAEANQATLDELNKVVIPALERVTPGAGAYGNEASWANPNWKRDYYDVNYNRLKLIKKKYDPKDLFFGPTMVGSEAWTTKEDGRLCRV